MQKTRFFPGAFLPSTVLVLCILTFGAPASAGSPNLLANGSFERPASYPNEERLLERGFDIEAVSGAWVRSWTLNQSFSPGRVRVVEEGGAPGGGDRYIKVDSVERGLLQIYASDRLSADDVYNWSLWARGEPDGSSDAPALILRIYKYGPREDRDGSVGYIGGSAEAHSPARIELSSEWKEYQGTVSTDMEGVDFFFFVLAFPENASVSVDKISVFK